MSIVASSCATSAVCSVKLSPTDRPRAETRSRNRAQASAFRCQAALSCPSPNCAAAIAFMASTALSASCCLAARWVSTAACPPSARAARPRCCWASCTTLSSALAGPMPRASASAACSVSQALRRCSVAGIRHSTRAIAPSSMNRELTLRRLRSSIISLALVAGRFRSMTGVDSSVAGFPSFFRCRCGGLEPFGAHRGRSGAERANTAPGRTSVALSPAPPEGPPAR